MSEASATSHELSAERYLEMAYCGDIGEDDRVELLGGMIVSMPLQSPEHASTVYRVQRLLESRVPDAIVRVRMTFVAGGSNVPEPDLAVVPGPARLYELAHPTTAQLIVEVAQATVLQDRMTKAAIYAAAGVACDWIVNLRDHCVEVFEDPDPARGLWQLAACTRQRSARRPGLAADRVPRRGAAPGIAAPLIGGRRRCAHPSTGHRGIRSARASRCRGFAASCPQRERSTAALCRARRTFPSGTSGGTRFGAFSAP